MGHRRILGKAVDFITGRMITDTDDERFRQKLARFLVEKKGYSRKDIQVKRRIEMVIEGKKVLSMVDFIVRIDGRSVIAIRYGPGSIVTRERPALAAARIVEPYQIPLTVVTNGVDAEVLDTVSGKVIASGLESIPDKNSASGKSEYTAPHSLSPERRDMEQRILTAYDWLEHSLECDDNWCDLEEMSD